MADTNDRGVRFRRLKWLAKNVLPSLGVAFAIACIYGYAKYAELEKQLPSLDKLLEKQFVATRVVDRNGLLIGELGSEKRIPVSYDDIAPFVVNALIASEDSDFMENDGVSYKGIVRAAIANFRAGKNVQGASTVTQQLVKLFLVGNEHSYSRKFKEAILARRVKEKFGPKKVLEMYLNKVNFGFNRNGIEAAAQFYFGKPARDLNLSESAMLIAVLPSPTNWSPLKNMPMALKKQGRVLKRMLELHKIDAAQYRDAVDHPPVLVPYKSAEAKTGQEILDKVRKFLKEYYSDDEINYLGFTIWTSVDIKVQAAAKEALKDDVRVVAKRNHSSFHPEGAVVVLDAERHIIAMVGGADYAPGGQNRATEAWRQPGSTFKGLVYAAGFELEKFGPNTEFSNVLTEYKNDVGPNWIPDNYRGEASNVPTFNVKDAFAESLNRVAARAICGLWPGSPLLEQNEYSLKDCRNHGLVEATIALSEKSGIKWSRLDPPGNNPSIALGSTGVTPMDMLVAYMAVGLDGEYVEPTLITKIEGENAPALPQPKRRHVVSGATVNSMKILLRAVVEEGTGRALRGKLPETAYGKTGTTNRSTNAWFVGGTASYWAIAWVGHKDQGTSLGRNETGAKTALPLVEVALAAAYGRESEAVKKMRSYRQEAEPVEAPEIDEEPGQPAPADPPASQDQTPSPSGSGELNIDDYEGSGTDVTTPGSALEKAAPTRAPETTKPGKIEINIDDLEGNGTIVQ